MSCRSLHSYNDLNKKTQTTGHDFVAGFSKAMEVAMSNDGFVATAMATSLRADFGAKIKQS